MTDDLRTKLIKYGYGRDFGMPLEEVLKKVDKGEYVLEPGYKGEMPLMKSASTGMVVKGTGRSAGWKHSTQEQNWTRQEFQRRAVEDFDEVYASLKLSAVGDEENRPDPRALKLWLEYAIGRPQEQTPDVGNAILEELFKRLQEPVVRTVRVIDAPD